MIQNDIIQEWFFKGEQQTPIGSEIKKVYLIKTKTRTLQQIAGENTKTNDKEKAKK